MNLKKKLHLLFSGFAISGFLGIAIGIFAGMRSGADISTILISVAIISVFFSVTLLVFYRMSLRQIRCPRCFKNYAMERIRRQVDRHVVEVESRCIYCGYAYKEKTDRVE